MKNEINIKEPKIKVISDSTAKEEPLQFKKILAEGDFIKIPKMGDIIAGKIIDISRSEIRLDIDGLTTGIVRGREFYDESNEYSNLKVGDEVEATVIDLENENGEMELSFRFAGHQKAWDSLNELKEKSEIIKALITDANKGGLMVRVGKIPGFLPVSQLMPEHYPRVPGGDKNKILDRLKSYIGKEFEVKVIDALEAEEKLIVSEKAGWEEKQKDVIASYKVGDVVEGKVTAVTDFGVFVEFGEDKLEGLVHISELAWQRIDNPTDFIKVGEKIKAEIIDVQGSKIFLSIKKLQKDPWENVNEKYKVGQTVKGKVLKINPFGLFVELDPDIHGLAHISELSSKPINDPLEVAKPGDDLEFKILSIESKDHRLGLSIKALNQRAESGEQKAEKEPALSGMDQGGEDQKSESPSDTTPAGTDHNKADDNKKEKQILNQEKKD
ncbi:S1 RNA-binding domain-containing protein [Candidatus Falkowbacteria bacterium]|nr:S1 RNA-binding domain-containing protein [Candidatus Falkowbacteria bacterium]